MAEKKVALPEGAIQVKAAWVDPDNTRQQSVDEAVLHYVNERVYISFGQLQVPVTGFKPDIPVEIGTVCRLVFSEASFHKILKMMNGVSGSVPDPTADSEA